MNINECGCRPYGWLGLDGNRCIRVIPRHAPPSYGLRLSSRVSQRLYALSPPATSMRAHCLSSGIWSAMKITFIRRLKSFHAATLSAALQFTSGYFSLGTNGMISAIRRSFQDHEGKLNESYLCDN